MIETIDIYPDYEKLKGISPFWDNEKRCLSCTKSDYNKLQSLNLTIQIDDLCYILILLKSEKGHNELHNELKTHKDIIYNDRLEAAKFLKLWEQDKRYAINKVRFDIVKETGYNPEIREYEYTKEDSFNIQNPEVIAEILRVVWAKYKYKSSTKNDFKEMLNKRRYVNKPNVLTQNLAHNLFKYLSENSEYGENKKYFIIGYLFQLSGIENDLSDSDYIEYKRNAQIDTYKSHSKFVEKRIRNKYFKGGSKTSKK